jgi:hypothetical protein
MAPPVAAAHDKYPVISPLFIAVSRAKCAVYR